MEAAVANIPIDSKIIELIDRVLRFLPRRVLAPQLVPQGMLLSESTGGYWHSTGPDSHFDLKFDEGGVPSGWVYVEGLLKKKALRKQDFTMTRAMDSQSPTRLSFLSP